MLTGFLLLAAMMAGLSFEYGRRLWLGLRSSSWQEAPARILEARVAHPRIPRTMGSIMPMVSFEYEVAGHLLVSDTISFRGLIGAFGGREVWALVNRYSPGQVVKIRYNPRNPAQAVLIPGVNTANWMLLLGSWALCAGCMALFWMARD